MNTSASYFAVPPGRYNFHICRADDREHPVKVQDVLLRDGVSITLSVHLAAGDRPQGEIIDDTVDPAKVNSGVLTVRQFLPGARVVVTAGPRARTAPLSYGEAQKLEDLPTAKVPIQLQATLRPGEAPRGWATEANFAPNSGNSPHATLLVVGDAYGRMRAIVVDDGHVPEPDPAPESSPATPSR